MNIKREGARRKRAEEGRCREYKKDKGNEGREGSGGVWEGT